LSTNNTIAGAYRSADIKSKGLFTELRDIWIPPKRLKNVMHVYLSPGCLVEFTSARSTSQRAKMGYEGEISIFRETISTKTGFSE